MEKIKQQFDLIHPLTSEAWNALKKELQLVHYKRKEAITSKGEIERYLYIVKSGIQRGFYVKDDKEITIVFTHSHSFSGIPESMFRKEASKYYLEALTESELYRIPYEKIQVLSEQYYDIDKLMHVSCIQGFLGLHERLFDLQALNAEERFLAFMKRSAYLINQIPHKYIASYLHMSPATFSKLLHQVNY